MRCLRDVRQRDDTACNRDGEDMSDKVCSDACRMTREEIEERMRLPILNICLAVLSKTPGDLSKAKNDLIDAVSAIVQVRS